MVTKAPAWVCPDTGVLCSDQTFLKHFFKQHLDSRASAILKRVQSTTMKKTYASTKPDLLHLSILLFSDLSRLAPLIEKKTLTGLKTAWGIDHNVISEVTYAVSCIPEERFFFLETYIFKCSYLRRKSKS